MKTAFQITKPGDVECTISITMPLKEWTEFRSQLQENRWPSSEMARAIAGVVRQAEERFYHREVES